MVEEGQDPILPFLPLRISQSPYRRRSRGFRGDVSPIIDVPCPNGSYVLVVQAELAIGIYDLEEIIEGGSGTVLPQIRPDERVEIIKLFLRGAYLPNPVFPRDIVFQQSPACLAEGSWVTFIFLTP